MPVAVSVIIPSYNSAQFLNQCLDSVVAQTLPPAEILLIDDGSTDGTRAVVESYVARYPHLVRYAFQKNAGQGEARNHGLRLAKSEWVAFLDADDWWEPQKLEKQTAQVESTPGVEFFYTSMMMHLPDGAAWKMSATPPSALWPEIRHSNKITPSTVLANRRLLLDAGGFDPQFRGTEDWELWVRLGPGLKMAYLDDALTWYRVSDAGISTKIDHMMTQERAVLNKTLVADLSGFSAFAWRRRIESLILFRAAKGSQFKEDPRELSFALQSVLQWPSPFFKPNRWKALAVALRRRFLS